ncbi:unnamed protein product [Brassica oleracea var. botrytis]
MPDRREVYVFGGCGDEADSLNWAEVFDTKTQTWEVLFVFTPKMPLNIEHSVVIDKELIYAVDDEGQDFSYSPSKCLFWTSGKTDSKPGHRSDSLVNCCSVVVLAGEYYGVIQMMGLIGRKSRVWKTSKTLFVVRYNRGGWQRPRSSMISTNSAPTPLGTLSSFGTILIVWNFGLLLFP